MILGTDISGNGGIYRYTVGSGTTFTEVLHPGDYTVTSMVVSTTGDTTFYGQRASDGAKILGNIAAGTQTVTVVSSGLPSVQQLMRMN